jgi:glycosyltransferase involved in cell wall biosynthesis
MTSANGSLSIVVPVRNEEAILAGQTEAMVDGLAARGLEYELILVENGSSDHTRSVCESVALRHPEIRVISRPEGDYGAALKLGIQSAIKDWVIIFNVEFWSLEFIDIARVALQTRALVIGSKSAPGAHDERPLGRRWVTRSYNLLLKILWGFDGTDTHGMKAFHRAQLLPIVDQCRCTGFVFDTEFVLRCQRASIAKLELPTNARELRGPGARSLLARVPGVLSNLWILWLALRFGPRN